MATKRDPHPSAPGRQHGLTLLELAIVMAVIAIVAASGDEIDVAAALIARNFLVIRDSESCRGGALPTVARQP